MKNNWLEIAESIQLGEFVYDLPDERIARYPLPERDQSQLLIYRDQHMTHHRFSDLPAALPAGALLVFNDTKVIPARAYFQKETGATIEILLLHPELPTRNINDAMLVKNSCVWECMIGNKKRWKPGDHLKTTLLVKDQSVSLSVKYHDYEKNQVALTWDTDLVFLDIVQALGEIPLPPYLKRDTEETDKQTYQTVYARQNGAVAAPTAGLHFTDAVLSDIAQKGIKKGFVTLHVGAGTFQPIKANTVSEHHMHSEQVVYTREFIDQLIENIDMIIPVGTTSMRSLESLYWYGVKLFRKETTTFFIEKLYPYPFEAHELPTAKEALEGIAAYMDANNLNQIVGETEIFIFPGYQFRFCKAIVTNFHQPGSTLILLVAAFVGEDWKRIYTEALSNGYRYLSYGDSSLLWGVNSI
jgi:S-adenosylmethionine:tRNA ribosyltransferase-isomerase